MSRRAALASIGAVLGMAPAAHGQIRYEASMSPMTIRYPDVNRVEYRLEMTTGPREEKLFVGFDKPFLPGPGAEPVGAPMGLGTPRLEGPGELGGMHQTIAEYAAGTCLMGYRADGVTGAELRLPANSRSTLVVPARAGGRVPWRANDLRLGFRVKGRGLIRPPRPRVVGTFAARVTLFTRPRTQPLYRGLTAFGPGQLVHVRGRVDPPVRNRIVTLRFGFDPGPIYYGFPPATDKLLARVRTDRRGRFGFSWRFRHEGIYSLAATYPRQRGGLLRGRSCTRGFRIGNPG